MMRLRSLARSWVLVASSLAADVGQQGSSTGDVGSGLYVLESDEAELTALANTLQQGQGIIRHKYNSSVFRGLVFQIPNATRAEEFHAELQKKGFARRTWSVTTSPEPAADDEQPGTQQKDERIRRAAKREDSKVRWTHLMTTIDKLHEKGYLGHGVGIAVIDAGVDHQHPALGASTGIYALVDEARGTWDAAVLNSVIIGTGKPQIESPSSFVSVAQQGSRLVRASEAAGAITLVVTPTSLAFNDTAHRVPSVSFRIQNQAKTTVQYQLSPISALTLSTLGQDNRRASGQAVQAPAKVQFSESGITLGPGEFATIDVSASDPEGLDVKRLPLWSGWIGIQGSDGTRQTLPYLGLAGAHLKSKSTLLACASAGIPRRMQQSRRGSTSPERASPRLR
ncbi:subtilisin-like serine protease PR1C, partial [Metarhizium brunneum ARSEF 3297]